MFAQLLTVDVGAIVLLAALGVLCSVALVAAVRWGAARRVLSPWLLAGLAPPVALRALAGLAALAPELLHRP